MLIDNFFSTTESVYKYLSERLGEGEFGLVSGYYSPKIMMKLLSKLESLERLEMILGHLSEQEQREKQTFTIVNDTLNLQQSLAELGWQVEMDRLIQYLSSDKVVIKTVHPDFCHAKSYIYKDRNQDSSFAILGSSNLTFSGLGGLQESVGGNFEANWRVSGGDKYNFEALEKWFVEISKKAQDHKSEVIAEINKFYKKEYTPSQIYDLISWHLFHKSMQENIDFENEKSFTKLKESQIWNRLYEFQQKGSLEILTRLEKHSFAILADGVGLGKTWQTLAVIKYYAAQGLDILVISPANLEQNWKKYEHDPQNSDNNPFYDDKIVFKTLSSGKLNDSDNLKKYDLIIVDESHNFRNPKSIRYQNLLANLQKDKLTKLLLLSATPINNNIKDIQYQFELGFCHHQNTGPTNLEHLFKKAQTELSSLQAENKNEIIKAFSPELISLISNFSISRNRFLISKFYKDKISFPVAKTQSVNLDEFEKVVDLLFKGKGKTPEINFTIYKPSRYLIGKDKDKKSAAEDQEKRETWLAKMMLMNMVKRLESSNHSFLLTLDRVIAYSESVLEKNEKHKQNKLIGKANHSQLLFEPELTSDEMEGVLEQDLFEEKLTVGKKIEYDIEKLGPLYFENLEKDLDRMKEVRKKIDNEFTRDRKFENLENEIKNSLITNKSKKILIFTTYFDTAKYLFEKLNTSFVDKNIALVSSGECLYKTGRSRRSNILRSFSPESMIYNELPKQEKEKYTDFIDFWKSYQGEEKQNYVDILIATDCISEGQNLQDCDTIINYDIHWNPVKLIQRNGRINRIGSKYSEVNIINFWPGKSLEDVLDLKKRIDFKMNLVSAVGATDEEGSQSLLLDTRQEQMLKMMETDYSEIENIEFGFTDFSDINNFKQEFLDKYKAQIKDLLGYHKYPKGIYTATNDDQKSVVFLFKQHSDLQGEKLDYHKAKINPQYPYLLIMSDWKGNIITQNTTKVLDYLKKIKDKDFVISDEYLPTKNIEKYQSIISSIVKDLENSNLEIEAGKNTSKPLFTPKADRQKNTDSLELITWFIVT